MNDQPQSGTETIKLSSLVINDAFQIRLKLDPATIERYRQSYKAEVPMPPIKVALVDGAPVLVDGFHRVEAMRRAGIFNTEAIVTKASRTEARWIAAEANLTHGLPLKAREVRLVFKAYVRARKHYDGKAQLKSYRAMGQELARPFSTIRNWMRQDFPKIAAQYSGEHLGHAEGGLQEQSKVSLQVIAMQHLDSALAAMRGITCPRERAPVMQRIQDLQKEAPEVGPWTPEDEDF
ncbi:ParB N-terminal domain-containing protein [Dongia deserti]|uniref:ParB N-terminal domain-containing protein n=1 Tax=Dongia deserti TaxID=2268030 RepID=UPI0013C4AB8E|nr:ParB N-terminal domain-containing protein [Dongia deserti]